VQPQFDPKSANVVANAIHGEVVPMNPLAENAASNLEIMSEKIAEGLREK
jgi:zinc transport system substrate-binding protein